MLSTSIVTYAQDVLSFYDGEQIHLRWKGLTANNLAGYKIYRKENGNWKVIGETKRLIKNEKIREIVGARSELYLKLAGVRSADGDFTDDVYKALIANNNAYQFFGAMTILDVNMARAMGEYYAFKPSGEGSDIELKVAALTGQTEQDIGSVSVSMVKTQQVEIPADLKGKADNGSVEIKWGSYKRAAEDHVGFFVYRSKNLLGPYDQLNSVGLVFSGSMDNGNLYVDDYIDPGTYYYYVLNYNAFGILSDPSEIIKVTVNPPSDMTGIYGLKARERSGRIMLEWDSTQTDRSFSIYRKKASEKKFSRLYPISDLMSFSGFDYLDRSSEQGISYDYFVQDQNGTSSDTISFALPDHIPPAAPVGVKGTVSKTGLVSITWTANKESDILGYEVERYTGDSGSNNFLLTAKPLATARFTENLGTRSQMAYRYVVFAVDQNYNRSVASEPVRLRRPDDIPPATPVIDYISLKDSILEFSWTPNLEWDFNKYKVYRKLGANQWTLYKTVSSNSLKDTLRVSGDVSVSISAIDLDGNESKRSDAHTMTYTPDKSLLSPSNGQAIDSNGHIFITWTPSKDKNVSGYLIERQEEGSDHIQLVKEHKEKGNPYYLDLHARSSGNYTYYITAYDKKWFVSKPLIIIFEAGK